MRWKSFSPLLLTIYFCCISLNPTYGVTPQISGNSSGSIDIQPASPDAQIRSTAVSSGNAQAGSTATSLPAPAGPGNNPGAWLYPVLPAQYLPQPPANPSATGYGALQGTKHGAAADVTLADGNGDDITKVPKNPDRPTIALALGGGGARSSACIGVLRVLEKNHIPIDFVSGSSMGAIIGSLYTAGIPLDCIQQMFMDKHHGIFKALAPVPPVLAFAALPFRWLASNFGAPKVLSIYRGNHIATFIDAHVPAQERDIEHSRIPFVAVASDLLTGKTSPIIKGDRGKAAQASSALPVVYAPVKTYNGKYLVDGGVRANLPTYAARQSQADIVIAVNVDEDLKTIDQRTLKSFRKLMNRVLSMNLAEIDEHQLEYADLQIRPDIHTISVYSTNPADAMRAIKLGEIAATQALPKVFDQIQKHRRQGPSIQATPAYYVVPRQIDVPNGAQPSNYGLTPHPVPLPNSDKKVVPTS